MSFKDMTDCPYIPLPEVLSFIVDNRGKTVPTVETGIPLIATNCIINNELYPVFEKIRYLSEDTYKNWFRAHPIPGDIIFVNKGAPGRVCLVPDPVGFCIAQDMMAFRVNEKIVNNKYLFAVLRSPQFQTQIEQFHVGTLIPHFKKGDLNKLLIPIPSKNVQEFIGNTYFELCSKIELNNRINKTLEAIAQAIFKSWFIDFEPFQDGEFEDSEMGRIPKGWRVIELGDVCESVSKKHIFNKNELIFLNTSDILAGQVLHNNYSEIDKMPGQAKKSIQSRDILYSEIRPINKRYTYVNFECNDYVVSTKLMVLRAKEELINSRHLYHFLTSEKTLNNLQTVAESRSGTFPQITFTHVSELKIILPPIKIESELGSIFELLYEKIDSNFLENRRLMDIRDTLLPKLMSGEIQVPIEEVN